MFQRRHYEFIADTLASKKPADGESRVQWHEMVDAFAYRFQRESAQFKPGVFYKRAGVGS